MSVITEDDIEVIFLVKTGGIDTSIVIGTALIIMTGNIAKRKK